MSKTPLFLILLMATLGPLAAQAQVVKFSPEGKVLPPEIQNTTIIAPTDEAPMPMRVPQAGSMEAVKAAGAAEAAAKATEDAKAAEALKKAAEVAAVKAKTVDKPAPAGQAAALKLYGQHKYPLAQQAFQKLINEGAANTETHMYLAYSFYYQRIYTKALKEFDWVGKYGVGFKNTYKADQTSMALRTLMRGICPGNCLKPGDSRWSMVDGHMIAKYRVTDGWKGFSEGHMGDVIEIINGEPFDMGKCPICGGTGTIQPLHDGSPLPGS
jgi:hypothetical protein